MSICGEDRIESGTNVEVRYTAVFPIGCECDPQVGYVRHAATICEFTLVAFCFRAALRTISR
jgi:hypothetical protein